MSGWEFLIGGLLFGAGTGVGAIGVLVGLNVAASVFDALFK